MRVKPLFVIAASLLVVAVGVIVLRDRTASHVAPGKAINTPARRILYYRSPMNAAIHSPVPMKDGMGMSYLPVYAPLASRSMSGHDGGKSSARRILYYRSPMNPAIHSPVPMKDGMGMSYLPVYAPRSRGPADLHVDHRLRESYGVTTTRVKVLKAVSDITGPGVVAVDQHRVVAMNTRVNGWLRTLTVDTVGDPVHRGALIAKLYAPGLQAAENDYLMLRSEHAGADLVRAAMMRLDRLGLTSRARIMLERLKRAPATLGLYAPISGAIVSIGAAPGHYVTPSTTLLTIAPLSPVWVRLALAPTGASRVHVGDQVIIHALGRKASGVVSYVYPMISSQERTLPVRAVFYDKTGWLRPGLYVRARVLMRAAAKRPTIPRSAVVHTGSGVSYVFVAQGHGHFRLQRVRLGLASGRWVVVRAGLKEGERVVVHGLFMLDADSHIHNLAARLERGAS